MIVLDNETLRLVSWLLITGLCFIFGVGFLSLSGRLLLQPFLPPLNCKPGPFYKKHILFLLFTILLVILFLTFPLVFKLSLAVYWFVFLAIALCLLISQFFSQTFLHSSKNILSAITGLITVFLCGNAVGTLLTGVPFSYIAGLQLNYQAKWLTFLQPFPLYCGVVSLSLAIMLGGAAYARHHASSSDDCRRALTISKYSALASFLLYAVGAVFVMAAFANSSFASFDVPGYYVGLSLLHPFDPNAAIASPLNKEVSQLPGGWVGNYIEYHWMLIAPLLAFIGVAGVLAAATFHKNRASFIFAGIAVAGIMATVGLSMYPFIIPSSSSSAHSLTIYDASATADRLIVFVTASAIVLVILMLWQVYRFCRKTFAG